jgi:hypothetical protein
MVEAAQAEVKVVNSKLLNIQNLPMTEVRAYPSRSACQIDPSLSRQH